MNSILIVTTGQRALRAGHIVGGAPVVARRQALALRELGCQVILVDLEGGHEGSTECVEEWSIESPHGEVLVNSWKLWSDAINPICPKSVKAAEDMLIPYMGFQSHILVQEALLGSVAVAAQGLGLSAIWQPNDYSFVCARSWLLTGAGKRCEAEANRHLCERCQLKGRSLLEAAVLRASFLANSVGWDRTPIHMAKLVEAAGNRGENAHLFIRCFSWFIAQSQPMFEVLLRHGAPEGRILRVDYGIESPSREIQTKRPKLQPVTFAYIARPTYEKGLHLLLQAWLALDDGTVDNARLLIYAPIDSAPRFRKRMLKRLLARCRNVEVRNVAVSSRLDEVYTEIDVAVQPCIWVDNNSQTMLEALVRRVPVIVPRHTSFAAGIVRDGENGVLVDLDDPSALKSALGRCVNEPSFLAKIQAATPFAFTNLDWAGIVLKWLTELPKPCDQKGAGD